MPGQSILVINTGSSSLKFGIYRSSATDVELILEGLADGIGQPTGKLELKDATGRSIRSSEQPFGHQTDALKLATQWLTDVSEIRVTAVGHRVVHGGPRLTTHQRITPALIAELNACLHFAPLHIPLSLELIASAQRNFPHIPQFACFDTAFHTTLPEAASRFPLPVEFSAEGIHRYGFHGLSCESILQQLAGTLPARTVIAHLGSGASLTALHNGLSVDTSMGLTPTGGIPMATRSGDLDPGVLLYLMRAKHMNADALEKLLNHNAGLIALSNGTSDMRQLESAAAANDADAQLALAIFTTAIRKTIAAYAAVLNGLDLLIFSGGIGEHSTLIRETVCNGLAFLGITLDPAANTAVHPVISTPESPIAVRIVPSQEDIQIARHCRTLMHQH